MIGVFATNALMIPLRKEKSTRRCDAAERVVNPDATTDKGEISEAVPGKDGFWGYWRIFRVVNRKSLHIGGSSGVKVKLNHRQVVFASPPLWRIKGAAESKGNHAFKIFFA